MCSIDDMVKDISCMLHDQIAGDEYARWSADLIKRTIMGSMSSIGEKNKKDFIEEKTVTLSAGCYHCFCDDCDEIVAVVSVGGDSCSLAKEGSSKYSGISSKYKLGCKTSSGSSSDEEDDGYGLVSMDENRKCCFRTEEPVPEGTTAIIHCYVSPSEDIGNGSVPDVFCTKHRAALVNIVLSQLRLVDSESVNATNASTRHQDLATFLGVSDDE